MSAKSKGRKAPFSMPLLEDVLTPEEQKLFNEQLNECKKRNYDSDSLTKKAEETDKGETRPQRKRDPDELLGRLASELFE